MKKVAIIMGSDSDLKTLEGAFTQLKDLGVPFQARVLSAHRTPEETAQYAKSLQQSGFGVVIAAAGMAAHLAGAVAAQTILPVIGIPISSGSLQGVDALYSTVMMPPGVPVAAVGINASKNAALLAAQVLAVSDPDLADKLSKLKISMAESVAEKDAKLQSQIENL